MNMHNAAGTFQERSTFPGPQQSRKMGHSSQPKTSTHLPSKGVTPDKEVVTYCRIGERSSFTWFVLKYLLGYPNVKNYDGSWTEWGNMVRNPIAETITPRSLAHYSDHFTFLTMKCMSCPSFLDSNNC